MMASATILKPIIAGHYNWQAARRANSGNVPPALPGALAYANRDKPTLISHNKKRQFTMPGH